MYAFNNRFRLSLWRGFPVFVWLGFAGFFVLAGLAVMFGIMSGKYAFGFLLLVGSLSSLFFTIKGIKGIKTYRINQTLRFGKRDIKKKDYFL